MYHHPTIVDVAARQRRERLGAAAGALRLIEGRSAGSGIHHERRARRDVAGSTAPHPVRLKRPEPCCASA